jgi:hypothetical protein
METPPTSKHHHHLHHRHKWFLLVVDPLKWQQVVHTEVCRLVEAEVYTVVIILAIVPVYTDSHNTMAPTV